MPLRLTDRMLMVFVNRVKEKSQLSRTIESLSREQQEICKAVIKILQYYDGPVGAWTLSRYLPRSTAALKAHYLPKLEKLGILERTNFGAVLTNAGKKLAETISLSKGLLRIPLRPEDVKRVRHHQTGNGQDDGTEKVYQNILRILEYYGDKPIGLKTLAKYIPRTTIALLKRVRKLESQGIVSRTSHGIALTSHGKMLAKKSRLHEDLLKCSLGSVKKYHKSSVEALIHQIKHEIGLGLALPFLTEEFVSPSDGWEMIYKEEIGMFGTFDVIFHNRRTSEYCVVELKSMHNNPKHVWRKARRVARDYVRHLIEFSNKVGLTPSLKLLIITVNLRTIPVALLELVEKHNVQLITARELERWAERNGMMENFKIIRQMSSAELAKLIISQNSGFSAPYGTHRKMLLNEMRKAIEFLA